MASSCFLELHLAPIRVLSTHTSERTAHGQAFSLHLKANIGKMRVFKLPQP